MGDSHTSMSTVKVLAIGDVCADIGLLALKKMVPHIIETHKVDFVIANCENALNGEGLDAPLASLVLKTGVDVITGGNHSLQDFSLRKTFLEDERILRPANISNVGGAGSVVVNKVGHTFFVINLLGREHLRPVDSPFACVDSLLSAHDNCITIIDFHAELAEEKEAFGAYVDGRVSLVYGTHTHVQTADEKILPHGTGYITDIGFVGAKNSVIGSRKEYAIEKQRFGFSKKARWLAHGMALFSGIIATIDYRNKKTISLMRILDTVEV